METIIKKITIITILLFSVFTFELSAKSINDINLPDTISNPQLILNGAGVRSKFIFDLYVAGLYLQKPNKNADEIINANKPMAIKLYITSSLISSDKMKNATIEGFEKSTKGNLKPLQKEIDEFLSVFKEDIKGGDRYTFLYTPNDGLKIYKNGNLKSTIEGLDFKKALFGIWLCDEPAQESLKKEMLGL